jgi:hypothetical protein
LKEVAHSQSLHLTNLRKAMRLRVLKLSQNNNILRQPPNGGLQGGQKDKHDQMFKEVAHSQSLHLTNLRKAMWLRVLKLSQNKNVLRRPPEGGLQGRQKDKPDRMFKEVAHSQSLRLTNLQKGCAATDVWFAKPFSNSHSFSLSERLICFR